MQTFIQLAQQRQSVRKFSDKPVDRELLSRCVQAAHLAPSAENVQPWRFIIVDEAASKERLIAKAFSGIFKPTGKWAAKAPVLVVLCAHPDVLTNSIGRQITGLPYFMIDMGISGEHFALQAAELGLGACWIGWFNSRGVKKALHLPRGWKPCAMFAVGWPLSDRIREKRRKPLEEILFFNKVD